VTSLFERARARNDGYRDIDPADMWAARSSVRMIDVREAVEFTGELGHVPGSELIPMREFPDVAEDWDKDSEIVFVCRSGNRSGRVAALLAGVGFTRTMNMVGGMIAYNRANLPNER
jgi:sulfur-carrier protein adenylyltransferase/sulfurtransferase